MNPRWRASSSAPAARWEPRPCPSRPGRSRCGRGCVACHRSGRRDARPPHRRRAARSTTAGSSTTEIWGSGAMAARPTVNHGIARAPRSGRPGLGSAREHARAGAGDPRPSRRRPLSPSHGVRPRGLNTEAPWRHRARRRGRWCCRRAVGPPAGDGVVGGVADQHRVRHDHGRGDPIFTTTHQCRTRPNDVPRPRRTPVATAASPAGIDSHGAVSMVRYRADASTRGRPTPRPRDTQNATTIAMPNQPDGRKDVSGQRHLVRRPRSRKPAGVDPALTAPPRPRCGPGRRGRVDRGPVGAAATLACRRSSSTPRAATSATVSRAAARRRRRRDGEGARNRPRRPRSAPPAGPADCPGPGAGSPARRPPCGRGGA